MIFQSREQAGQLLGEKLKTGENVRAEVVLAIPRGGVVVGSKISQILSCPLKLIVTKKIGAPGNPELAVGAVGLDKKVVWDQEILGHLGLVPEQLKEELEEAQKKVKETCEVLGCVSLDLTNQTVILADDGVATGATMAAALEIVRQLNPKRLVVAVPVIAKDSLSKLEELADEVIFLEAPEEFYSVGQFYQEFPQITDDEVKNLIK